MTDWIKPMTYDVKQLYTEKTDTYLSFISFCRYAEGLQAFFESSDLLRPGFRVLDAGCGTGVVTFALLKALRCHNLDYRVIHGFDLTPAMLARFEEKLQEHNISDVHFREANVLELDDLPSSWTNYDLIVSSGMLEYVPRVDFVTSLAALRARLAQHGCVLLFITRKNWVTKPLIEWWWKANRYTREELREAFASADFGDVTFRRFPYSCFWHNYSEHVVEGRLSQKDAA